MIAAPLVTCAVVGAGVLLSGNGPHQVDLATQARSQAASVAERSVPVSRDDARTTLRPRIAARLWSTADLDLRSAPAETARTAGELHSLSRVAVTGLRRNGYAQVVVGAKTFWVTADYLAAAKPTDPAHLPVLDKSCAGTSAVEHGITAAAIRVYRAVCNNFPQVSHYGGYDAHGEHRSGRALDIMTSDVALGTAIADFLRAHAAELNLFDVIWRQHIFTPERGGEGWRSMPNRGSATANHYDHVHVSVY